MKPQALLLSPEVPFPAVGGGALRTASIFEFLAKRFTLDLITFRQPDTPDPRNLIPMERIRRLLVVDLPVHDKAIVPRVMRNLNRAIRNRPPLLDRFSGFHSQIDAFVAGHSYQLVIIEHFWCAPYAERFRPVTAHLVLDLHNIESAWHQSLAASEKGAGRLLHRRFQNGYEGQERAWLPRFDQILVTSTSDAARVSQLAPGSDCIVYPNAIPWVEQPRLVRRDEIIFTGNLEYHPNVSAVRYFNTQIWPDLRTRWPLLNWTIAGKNSHAIHSLVRNDPRIRVLGTMSDAVTTIAAAKVAVVPLLAGSGTRIKILEAWAAGTPVVSTSLGAEGLDAISGQHLILADQPQEFSQAVSNLLQSEDDRTRIAFEGRQLYEKNYTCDQAWSRLCSLKGVL